MGKKILLVEPNYYTTYPPLGLLKLATYFRNKKYKVELLWRDQVRPHFVPDEIYITSLFTYAWKPVHEAVALFKHRYPKSKIVLGGIYASLLPEHAASSGADVIYKGLFEEAERCVPAWDLVPEWDGSIIITSRGCIRKCPFCVVPILEGKLRTIIDSIKPYVYPTHRRIIFWDNNILATSHWERIFDELEELGRWVDFNQGLDARLVDEGVAARLARLKIKYVRIAYDYKGQGKAVENAVKWLAKAGIRRKSIIVYTLYNFRDDPEDFKERITHLLDLGVVSYPMRFQPLTSLRKNSFISPKWSKEELKMVTRAKWALGWRGAFPPMERTVKKFTKAKDFHAVFT